VSKRGAIGCDISRLPSFRIRGKDAPFLMPGRSVRGHSQAGVPDFAVEAGIERVVCIALTNHRRIQGVDRVPLAGRPTPENRSIAWFPAPSDGRPPLLLRKGEVAITAATAQSEQQYGEAKSHMTILYLPMTIDH